MLLGLVFLPIVFLIMPWLSSMFVLKIVLFIGGIAWAFINVQAYPLVADLGGLTKIGFLLECITCSLCQHLSLHPRHSV